MSLGAVSTFLLDLCIGMKRGYTGAGGGGGGGGGEEYDTGVDTVVGAGS